MQFFQSGKLKRLYLLYTKLGSAAAVCKNKIISLNCNKMRNVLHNTSYIFLITVFLNHSSFLGKTILGQQYFHTMYTVLKMHKIFL